MQMNQKSKEPHMKRNLGSGNNAQSEIYIIITNHSIKSSHEIE